MAKSNITVDHLNNMTAAEKAALRKQLYLLVDKAIDGEPRQSSTGTLGFGVKNGKATIVAASEQGQCTVSVDVWVNGTKDPELAAEAKTKRAAVKDALQSAGLRS